MITLLLEHAERQGWPTAFVHLDRPQFWLPEVSRVFHGRDVFAPVAAHLANGTTLSALGTPVSDPLRLTLPRPERTPTGWRGEIIHIDHFGNLASNILVEHLPEALRMPLRRLPCGCAGWQIRGLVKTFGDRSPGELAALFGSTGNLIVSVVNGSAAETLGAKMETGSRSNGWRIELRWINVEMTNIPGVGRFYAWDTLLSAVVGGGGRWMTDAVYRTLLLACGVFFIYLGGTFLVHGMMGYIISLL